MPYVPPAPLGSSIFLYPSEDDANKGANWGGSGLLVGIPSQANPSRVHLYAATNDHVSIPCPVARLVDKAGNAYVLPGTTSDWVSHPDGDDVAIRSLGAVPEARYWYVPQALLLAQADLSSEDRPDQISPGDDCLMVGRYINRELRQFDRPVVRFGNLAMLPERIYQDERSFDQESFLVDMRSQSGFSGSPVFVYYEDLGWRWLPPLPERLPLPEFPPLPESLAYEDKIKEIEARHEEEVKVIKANHDAVEQRVADRHLSGVMGKTWLLGIDWGHLPAWADVFDGNTKVGRMRASSGMAGVVPAWKLNDLLIEQGVEMARAEVEKQLSERDEGAAVLDSSKSDEFERFEDLTRRLVQVPKRELDKKPRGKS